MLTRHPHLSGVSHGGEASEQVERSHEDVGDAVLPRLLESQAYAAIRELLDTVVAQGRPQNILAELFQSLSVTRGHTRFGVKVKAVGGSSVGLFGVVGQDTEGEEPLSIEAEVLCRQGGELGENRVGQ